MNAVQVVQGNLIFILTLTTLPSIKTHAILSHIHPFSSLTPEQIIFLMLKMIKMCSPKSIQQLIGAVTESAQENSYMRKVLVLYTLSLLVTPLSGLQKPKDFSLQHPNPPQIFIYPLDHEVGDSIFYIRFISKIRLTEQHAIQAIWTSVKATLAKYNTIIIYKASQDLYEIRYKDPVWHNGVQIPSVLRINSEKEVFLTYPYEHSLEGMQMSHYLQLVSLASGQNSQYQFWEMMDKLLFAFEGLLKRSSKQGQYYGSLSISNLSVQTDNTSITILAHTPALRIEDWKAATLPKRLARLFPNMPDPTEKTFASTDRWSAAIIFLQAIAIRHRIQFFMRQVQQEEEGKTTIDLGKFLSYLQTESYIFAGHFLRKIRLWASLDDLDDHLYYQPLLQPTKSEEDNNFNNLSLAQISEVVNNNPDSSLGTIVSLNNNLLVSSNSKDSTFRQQFTLSTQELLLNLNFCDKNGKGSDYVAQTLNQQELQYLQDRMLADATFFQMMEFDMKPSSTKHDRCPKCLKISDIYINSCGHGKCKYCLLLFVEVSILAREDQQPFKVKCDASQCQAHFCYSFTKQALKLDDGLKRKYCKLLLSRYATCHSDQYVSCRQKNCNLPFVIYRKRHSRVLFCQACNSAFCIDCRRNCHKPLTCKHFAEAEAGISEEVAANLRHMKWPLDDDTAREDERRLREAGIQAKLADSYRMVWQWLVLYVCRSSFSSSIGPSQNDFLKMLSEKVAKLLREIHRYCKKGSQADDNCINLCFELLDFHQKRKDILSTVYSV